MSLIPRNFLDTQNKYAYFALWSVFFGYAVSMALIFQNVIVPNMASLQGSGKLLAHDAIYFDSVAWALAKEIQLHGWNAWQLFPANGATGNVGILAALYVVFGHDPSLMIPINACLHASAGLIICLLSIELSSDRQTGLYAGVIAAGLFVIFPSALSWYGQIHKDSFAITGTLLAILVWVKIIQKPSDKHTWYWVLIGMSVAVLLIGIVRPYGLTMLLVVSGGAIILSIILARTQGALFKQTLLGFTVVTLIAIGVIIVKGDTNQLHRTELISSDSSDSRASRMSQLQWKWIDSKVLPDKIEHYIESAATTRKHMINFDIEVGAGSTVDADIAPRNINEVLLFLPRALQIAALAPFPNDWFAHRNIPRLLISGEMVIYYLCLPGLLFLFRFNRKPAVWLTLYFALSFMAILGFTIPNLGTLYRYRYAYFAIILMLGVLGWVIFLERRGIINKLMRFMSSDSATSLQNTLPKNSIGKKRKHVVGLGIYIMLLTFIGFIGFFYRDILMANIFGFGQNLDSFFIALLIPMTIVTIVCMPLGAAFTPLFLKTTQTMNHGQVERFIQGVSFFSMLILFFASVTIYWFLPHLLPFIVKNNVSDSLEQIIYLVTLALPILFFSGPLILGNAVLNASGKVLVTGIAQLVVPVIAILSVIILGKNIGVQAVMMGMIVGQVVNLIIIQVQLKKIGYSLVPHFDKTQSQLYSPLISQYFPLVASAFFISMAMLVNSFLAMALPEGSVSIYNLGSKMVLLITGLLTAGISAVILPYFATLMAKNHLVAVRKELSVFLLLLTFISIPLSVILFVWAEPIIKLVFSGGDFNTSDLKSIVRVMQYAVVQIPFFACNILLLKFATATKHVLAILMIAILGLLINVAMSLFLMEYMGVAGIALGVSISMLITTVFLLVILARYGHIQLFDLTVILLNWLLFITLLMSVHFRNYPGGIATAIAYGVLLFGYVKPLLDNEKRKKLSGSLA